MVSLSLKAIPSSAKIAIDSPRKALAEGSPVMRMVLFIAVVANSADLLATTFGIHLPQFNNREGNPLLADLAHNHWWLFALVKGGLVPLLILRLNAYRRGSPVLASAGLILVTLVLTVAVGQWIGWMAGRHYVVTHLGF